MVIVIKPIPYEVHKHLFVLANSPHILEYSYFTDMIFQAQTHQLSIVQYHLSLILTSLLSCKYHESILVGVGHV